MQQITVADLGLDEEGFVLFLDSTSADGRFLTFTYVADGTDAIAPETTNFLYDRSDGSVVNLRDSLPSAADGPIALSSVISPDGRHVAFTVFDQVLEAEPEPFSIHGLWIYDHLSGTAFEVLPRSSGRSLQFAEPLDFSEDGRFLLFAALDQDLLTADVNAGWDFFLYDQTTGITELVSVPVLDAEPRVADQDEFFTPRPSGEISPRWPLCRLSIRSRQLGSKRHERCWGRVPSRPCARRDAPCERRDGWWASRRGDIRRCNLRERFRHHF